ncbi:MAG: RnfABCDGE type electron transport complex subunit D [Oscillospiraceae bacterium]|nr:RnfABCDGE type electron transport complex subunit D [Oscillospiraceae bacterium]
MKAFSMSPAPHIHSGASTSRVMLDVVIALLPASVAAVAIFGIKALWIILACVIGAVVSEALFNMCTGRKQTIGDMSAVVTGLLLALNLSTNVPLWQCVVGAAFAIIVVKCLFGGLGCNFANPAITARVFMLITFSAVAGGSTELYSGATPLELLGTEGAAIPGMGAMFLGTYGGAIGETSSVALLIGFAYLLVRKVISWHIPVVFIGTVFVLTFIAGGANFALYQILAGGLFIGAIFMATDYVTSPITKKGKVIFAVGCGVITFIVRYFCAYPEGVSFSILIMNLFVPIIERFSRNIPLGGGK